MGSASEARVPSKLRWLVHDVLVHALLILMLQQRAVSAKAWADSVACFGLVREGEIGTRPEVE